MTSIEIRAFAAARAALGWSRQAVPVPGGATVADVLATLREQAPQAVPVLERCAVLLDGRRVAAPHATPVGDSRSIDLLPPFAGG